MVGIDSGGSNRRLSYLATVSFTRVDWSTRVPAGGNWAMTEPGLTGSLGGAFPLPTGADGDVDIAGRCDLMPTL